MSEEERENFDDFVGTMSPIYQSAIIFSSVSLNLGELDMSEILEVLSGGIEAIEGNLRRQSVKDYFDKTSVFVSPCTDSERETVLEKWEPIMGDMARDFIRLEGEIKESFFDTL